MDCETNPDQRSELLEMAQRLEDLIAQRAADDERAMIARLDQALADIGVAAANKVAPEAKLAIGAAVRSGSREPRRTRLTPTSQKGPTP